MLVPSIPGLYGRLAAYLLAALLIATGGYRLASWRWQAKYDALTTSVAQERQQAAQAALTAQRQRDADAEAIRKHNQEIIDALQKQTADAAADRDHQRDLVQRLLDEAARAAAGGGGVSEAAGRSIAAAAGGAGRDEAVNGLLVDAAAECERNANRLDALAREVAPQL